MIAMFFTILINVVDVIFFSESNSIFQGNFIFYECLFFIRKFDVLIKFVFQIHANRNITNAEEIRTLYEAYRSKYSK